MGGGLAYGFGGERGAAGRALVVVVGKCCMNAHAPRPAGRLRLLPGQRRSARRLQQYGSVGSKARWLGGKQDG
eukprot:356367-Chlamydomonas_euryale.AAC.2